MAEQHFADTGMIDWLLVEFSGGKEINGELVPAVLDLVDRHLVRILDALFIHKAADGAVDVRTTHDLDPDEAGALGPLIGASSGLVDEQSAAAAAAMLDADSAGLLLVYENLWALPFARAAHQVGGQLAGTGRIPIEAVMARLDELEA